MRQTVNELRFSVMISTGLAVVQTAILLVATGYLAKSVKPADVKSEVAAQADSIRSEIRSIDRVVQTNTDAVAARDIWVQTVTEILDDLAIEQKRVAEALSDAREEFKASRFTRADADELIEANKLDDPQKRKGQP